MIWNGTALRNDYDIRTTTFVRLARATPCSWIVELFHANEHM